MLSSNSLPCPVPFYLLYVVWTGTVIQSSDSPIWGTRSTWPWDLEKLLLESEQSGRDVWKGLLGGRQGCYHWRNTTLTVRTAKERPAALTHLSKSQGRSDSGWRLGCCREKGLGKTVTLLTFPCLKLLQTAAWLLQQPLISQGSIISLPQTFPVGGLTTLNASAQHLYVFPHPIQGAGKGEMRRHLHSCPYPQKNSTYHLKGATVIG